MIGISRVMKIMTNKNDNVDYCISKILLVKTTLVVQAICHSALQRRWHCEDKELMRLDDGCQQNGWSGHPSNLSRSEDDNLGFRYHDLNH